MVVVVDDRSDIWKWSQNLYQVVPYVFFQGTADINATVHCNSLEVNIDNQQISTRYEPPGGESCSGRPQTDTKDNTLEEDFQNIEKPQFSDVDNELEIVASVLKEIHTQYYSLACSDDTGGLKPNTCSIMSRMKSNVLKGTKIVFSGISPTNADITSNELWIGASIFGAECSLELDSSVTHVVSVRNNSMKAIMSRKYLNVYLVRPEWLVHSIGRWMRQDEVEYRHPEPPVSPETFERDNTIFQHGDIPGADRVEIFEDFAGRTMNGAEIVPHISKEEWDKMNAEVDEVLCESSTSDNSGASSSGDYPDAGRHGIEYESDNRHPRGDTLSVSGSSGTDGDGRLHKCLKISGTSSTPSQDQADDAWNELNEVLSEGFADEFSGREI